MNIKKKEHIPPLSQKILRMPPKKMTTSFKPKDFPLKTTLVKKPVKGVKWEKDEPKGEQRIALHKVCPKCVLIAPKKKADAENPKNYKFPVCTKLSSTASQKKCELNCTGILAANRRARLTRMYPDVQKLTASLLQKFKCTKASIERASKTSTSKTMKLKTMMKPKTTKPKTIKPKTTMKAKPMKAKPKTMKPIEKKTKK